jgi:SulP family sulfate permease
VTATTTVSEVTPEYIEAGHEHSLQNKPIPEGVAIFRIHGPFLFGSTDKLSEVESRMDELPPVVILRLRNMTAIDATGLSALENLAEALHASGRHLILCGMLEQPARLMAQARFARHVGKRNIAPNFNAAVERATRILQRRHNLPIREGGEFGGVRIEGKAVATSKDS